MPSSCYLNWNLGLWVTATKSEYIVTKIESRRKEKEGITFGDKVFTLYNNALVVKIEQVVSYPFISPRPSSHRGRVPATGIGRESIRVRRNRQHSRGTRATSRGRSPGKVNFKIYNFFLLYPKLDSLKEIWSLNLSIF